MFTNFLLVISSPLKPELKHPSLLNDNHFELTQFDYLYKIATSSNNCCMVKQEYISVN